MRWCITLANPQGIIFDPYAGSGSTLRAAFDMGLSAIGCDVEKHYCEKAVERLAQNTLFTLPNNRLQRTAIAASQQSSLFANGVLPSKARGATRRR